MKVAALSRRVARVFLASALSLGCLMPSSGFGHGEAHIRIAALTREIDGGLQNPARLHLQRAELFREDGNWKEATSDYDRALVLGADAEKVNLGRAKVLVASGEVDQARTLLNDLIRSNPQNFEAYLERAQLYKRIGDKKGAIADFQFTVPRHPAPEYQMFLDLAELVGEEQPIEALRVLDLGIKRVGPVIPLQRSAVEIEIAQGKFPEALKRLDGIMDHASRKEEWWTRRAEVLMQVGRTDDARASLKKALIEMDMLPRPIRQATPMITLHSRIQTLLQKLNTQHARLDE